MVSRGVKRASKFYHSFMNSAEATPGTSSEQCCWENVQNSRGAMQLLLEKTEPVHASCSICATSATVSTPCECTSKSSWLLGLRLQVIIQTIPTFESKTLNHKPLIILKPLNPKKSINGTYFGLLGALGFS